MDRGQLDKALQQRSEVINAGCLPDAKLYNAGCAKEHRLQAASEHGLLVHRRLPELLNSQMAPLRPLADSGGSCSSEGRA